MNRFKLNYNKLNLIEICGFPYRNKDSEGTI